MLHSTIATVTKEHVIGYPNKREIELEFTVNNEKYRLIDRTDQTGHLIINKHIISYYTIGVGDKVPLMYKYRNNKVSNIKKVISCDTDSSTYIKKPKWSNTTTLLMALCWTLIIISSLFGFKLTILNLSLLGLSNILITLMFIRTKLLIRPIIVTANIINRYYNKYDKQIYNLYQFKDLQGYKYTVLGQDSTQNINDLKSINKKQFTLLIDVRKMWAFKINN